MSDLIEKVARAILRQQLDEIDMGISEKNRERHVDERWMDREPEAKAAIAVVLKDIDDWHPIEYGIYGWNHTSLIAYARENGVSLDDEK